MGYDDPSLKEFAGYLTAREPGRRERADAWATAIGLQAVDGLRPSAYLYEVAKRHIEGDITAGKARDLVDDYYETKSGRALPDDIKEADKVSARIIEVVNDEGFDLSPAYFSALHGLIFEDVLKGAGGFREVNTRTTAVFAIKYLKELGYAVTDNMFKDNSWYFRNALVRACYENPPKGVARAWEPLERFFENLLLGKGHELKSRYLLVGLTESQKKSLSQRPQRGGQKEVVRKGGQKTGERILVLLADHPHLTRAGLSNALGICSSAVQKHIANLKRDGRLRRVGPDKGGHWAVAKT